MQVTFNIDDSTYAALVAEATYLDMDVSDLLEHGANLVLWGCQADRTAVVPRSGAAYTVDPVTKAVTRVAHPLARPEDWDRAMARAKRKTSNPLDALDPGPGVQP